jgi:PAS domain S-box-containing protein
LIVWELEDPADPAGMRLVYSNPAAEAATGLPVEGILGRTMREVLPGTVETQFPAVLAEVALGGESRNLGDVAYGDERMSMRTFSARIFPLHHRRVGVAFNDVTAERAADARAVQILESMSDAFYSFDREGRFTYVNAEGARQAQRTREELLGKVFIEVFPEMPESVYWRHHQRAMREQVMVEFEALYEPYGTWNRVRLYPSPDGGLAIFSQDVTDRKQIEAQLLQVQKLDAIGQLAGGIAHNFNNLLTVIDGFAALLQGDLKRDPDFVEQALWEIRGASARAVALTAKLLTFSRTKMLQPKVAEVNAIVSSALDLVGPLIGEHIRVQRRLDPDAGSAFVDVTQIEQVIVNLATNARDAMPGGGNLSVETSRVELDSDVVSDLSPGSYVSIIVRDDGSGMDKHTLEQIFDPFFTTKPVGEGTGLGLSTAYGTISQSGGHIDASSAPGEGTTMTVYLPRSERAIPAERAATAAAAGGGGERILVVEDEVNVRHLVVAMLKAKGYQVVDAPNAEEALLHCAGERFDLMITDMVMPGDDGPTLARAAIALQPGLPVLYMSGYTQESFASLDLESSPTGFVSKPFTSNELAERVQDLLASTHTQGA